MSTERITPVDPRELLSMASFQIDAAWVYLAETTKLVAGRTTPKMQAAMAKAEATLAQAYENYSIAMRANGLV